MSDNTTTQRRITVIGSANVDMIMAAPHLPAVGETVTDCTFLKTYGGKGANQATAVARAAGDETFCTFICCLGNDSDVPVMIDNFRRDGMDVSRIVRMDDVPSGSALVMFDGQGNNYLTVAPGSNYRLSPTHIEQNKDVIESASLVVMQMEIPHETILAALDMAQAARVPTLFSYAPVRDKQVPIDARINGLVVNENEAETLTNLAVGDAADALKAASELRAMGVGFVVVTLGAEGAVVSSDEFVGQVPAFAVRPLDTTAAGDTFCGALAVALVEGLGMEAATRFACAASAISVTKMGAQPSIPTRADIDVFLEARTL